ncbi:kinase-like domain-containing protein [Mycena epipterygia]|nr:kinase-like domain-containing protein [Mycena epipterygia]
MDVTINRPTPAWQNISHFLDSTLPKLILSYGELIAITEEVEVLGDLFCLMQNALVLVRLSNSISARSGSEVSLEYDSLHVVFKVFLHHITRVNCTDSHLYISTDKGTLQFDISPDHMCYRYWKPTLIFLTARRLAFETRLRICTPWSDEDGEEAEFFTGDLPAAARNCAYTNLETIYGPVVRQGDVKQHIQRQVFWRTKEEVEFRFLVLRECALLLYKERELPKIPSRKDQCISLRAVTIITRKPGTQNCIFIRTTSKTVPLVCESYSDAGQWMHAIQAAAVKFQCSPKRGRPIGALELVNHLTTQVTIPRDPYANGGFASIYMGTLKIAERGSRPEVWKRQTVAVKVFVDRKSEGRKFERDLRREVAVWYRLHHPNVVPLLGITYDFGTSLSMISPWLGRGTLNTYLKSGEPRLQDFGRLLMEVATGLTYLHSENVIHGDLHPANILITDAGHAQLTDFGLSMIMPEFEGTSYMTSSIRGAVRWAAPEVFRESLNSDTSLNVSAMSDVYSFGGIMYQVLCGEIPFFKIHNDVRVVIAVKDGQRPARCRRISDTNWEFLLGCWEHDPTKRSSLREITEFLGSRFQPPFRI